MTSRGDGFDRSSEGDDLDPTTRRARAESVAEGKQTVVEAEARRLGLMMPGVAATPGSESVAEGKRTLVEAEARRSGLTTHGTAAPPAGELLHEREVYALLAFSGLSLGRRRERRDALDPAAERKLLGLLEQPLAGDDVRGIQARVQSLVAVFQAIPEAARRALHDRLAAPKADDPLGHAFRAHLHPATQARLLGVLCGESVPLPERHDAMTHEGFLAHLPPEPIRIEPAPLVIHPRFSPCVTAHVSLASDYGPPSDGPEVQVVVRVFDPEGIEHGTARMPWLPAMPASGAAAFTFGRAGSYRIACEVSQGGLVIAQRLRTVEVTSPGAEVATQAGLHAAATAWASGDGVAGTVAAAGMAALHAGPAGDLATAMELSPEQRRDAHTRIAARMAEDMDPAARAQLADDRNLLEFAAANAAGGAVTIDRPVACPADQITLQGMDRGSVEVSADPAFLRHWVEQTYLSQGLAGIYQLPDLVVDRAADDVGITRDRSRQEFAIRRVIPALAHQIQIFQSEIDAFERQFGAAATRLVGETLDESERVARAELSHYGIDVRTHPTTFRGPDDKPGRGTQTVTTTTVVGGDNAAARDMARAAGELAANQREIDRMRARVRELRDIQHYREHGEPGAGAGAGAEPAPSVDPDALASAPEPAHLAELLASLDRRVTQADHAHQARIAAHTETYPLLASYKRSEDEHVGVDADALDRLHGSGRGQAIYDRIAPVLSNIAATRAALGGRLNVWKEPRVVQLTMAQLLVAPGSLRGAMIERKVASEQEGSWTDGAIMALSFGLAILTAIPTGGSSLVAGVIIAADLAGAVTDVYLVVDHLRAYRLDTATAGTDLDVQARAISAEQPSLFWLAFDLVATGAGLSAAARTFGTVAKDLAKAERMAATGARLSVEEADMAVARIHSLAREGKMSADVAERAEGKIRLATEDERSVENVTSHAADAAHVGEDGAHQVGHVGTAEDRLVRGRHDVRARVSPENLVQLEQRLGVPVVLDDTLSNGVELHYVEKRGALGLGTDIEPTAVRVGRNAVVDDILAHRATIARVTRYNGVVGKLRGLWDRIVVDTAGKNPFKRGERGWESFEEMRKLDELIELRRARWNPRTLDAHTLDEEIAFLEGRRAYHEEIVRTAQETGAIQGAGHLDAPDIGKVTEEAKAKGYRLPGADEGTNPDWYYYRNKRDLPGEYELAVKPSAPEEAKPYRAVTKDGTFERLEPGDTPRPQTHLTSAWTDSQVIDHLWADDSFSAFAKLLERERLATREEINAAIVARSANRSKLGSIIDDTVRGNVKDVFRPRLVQKLTDPALDAKASWRRMRQMLDGLENADRGNLVELWYQARYAKGAEHRVPAKVARTGDKAGQVEARKIDLVEGNRAIEIKDVGGPIDKDQYKAYLDMAQSETQVRLKDGEATIRRVSYVFTRPEGARANLGFFAKELREARAAKLLSIEVFDMTGTKHTVTTAQEALSVLAKLGGPL